ncbi:MAG: hypothetical protein K8S00_10480 [Bacteroidales bacterium]|nr:hypothetical protein [Bacteroidales bacterium]
MKKINKELEEKVKVLVKANKAVEAVMLVQKKLALGLKLSKEIVDRYKIDK